MFNIVITLFQAHADHCTAAFVITGVFTRIYAFNAEQVFQILFVSIGLQYGWLLQFALFDHVAALSAQDNPYRKRGPFSAAPFLATEVRNLCPG